MQLFPFQREAVEKLWQVRNILLGDEMGLGKTHQAIAIDLMRRSQFPGYKLKTLVVCPLAMISTWTKAWFLWNSDLRILPINNKDRTHFLDELQDDNYDVFICHWPVLRIIGEELAGVQWYHVIADEAHSLQNKKSKQTVALKAIPTGYKSALTGTPAFDKPDDLWSILNWLYPKHWSSYWNYYNQHIQTLNFNGYKTIIGVANSEKLQAEMAGFYVRRRKEEVLHDLPEKYYTEIEVELTPQQRRAYDSMKNDMLSWIGTHEAEPVAAPIVIAQLTRLQQFAVAFAEITKKKVMKQDEATGEVYEHIEEKMILSEPSSKIDAVMDVIKSLSGRQVVIFSQFAQVIELIAARLAEKGITCGKFIGSTPANQRARIITDFQDGKIQVFAGTISAGGVGITLTAAQTVIFTDRAWSNALNLQAEDRLHRIGQKSAVQVIDIIAKKTIDAKRIKVIQQKWKWIKRLIGDTNDDPNAEEMIDDDLT